ncbi:MAG: hypothetical protein JO182_11730 [Acidobacteriaceae bacterium]|nr:hypothetical protein [Acidobacteriaceae bacterium]
MKMSLQSQEFLFVGSLHGGVINVNYQFVMKTPASLLFTSSECFIHIIGIRSDVGPVWFATLSPQWTCTLYSWPFSRRTA